MLRSSVPADVRERIVAARAAGRTLRAICDELNAQRVPCGQGAARWAPETVRGIAVAAERRGAELAAPTARPPDGQEDEGGREWHPATVGSVVNGL